MLLESVVPDRGALTRWIAPMVTEPMIRYIAELDYGCQVEEYAAHLRTARDGGVIPASEGLMPFEVLRLMNYHRPDEESLVTALGAASGKIARGFAAGLSIQFDSPKYCEWTGPMGVIGEFCSDLGPDAVHAGLMTVRGGVEGDGLDPDLIEIGSATLAGLSMVLMCVARARVTGDWGGIDGIVEWLYAMEAAERVERQASWYRLRDRYEESWLLGLVGGCGYDYRPLCRRMLIGQPSSCPRATNAMLLELARDLGVGG
jgi:hypothetical protein